MKNEKQLFRLGKFLRYILRHKPEEIGIELDEQGWTNIPTLLEKMNDHGKSIDRETLEYIVANNNKKRYAIDSETNRIRANQGHSLSINLGYQPQQPPNILYHGTAQRFIDSIFTTGLGKRNRHHVHLSADLDTATSVGKRHGKVVILEVLAEEMYR
ncbi:MAG: putative RNA 2'-phosphotransferase, partial [Nonlabens sp.]